MNIPYDIRLGEIEHIGAVFGAMEIALYVQIDGVEAEDGTLWGFLIKE